MASHVGIFAIFVDTNTRDYGVVVHLESSRGYARSLADAQRQFIFVAKNSKRYL